MFEDVKNLLKVDRNNLHIEWERQPQLFMEWSEKWVKATLKRDRLKEKIDLVKAKLDGQIRENPDLFGFTKKPTEAAISAAIVKSDEYREALDDYFRVNEEVNMLSSVRTSLEHRKKALEALTQLFISGYYSQPTLSETEVFSAKEAKHKKVKEELRKALKASERLQKGKFANEENKEG